MSGSEEFASVKLPKWLLLSTLAVADKPVHADTKSGLRKEVFIRLQAAKLYAPTFDGDDDDEKATPGGDELVRVDLPLRLLLDIQSDADGHISTHTKRSLANKVIRQLQAVKLQTPPFGFDNDENATSSTYVDAAMDDTPEDEVCEHLSSATLTNRGTTAPNNEVRERLNPDTFNDIGTNNTEDALRSMCQKGLNSESKKKFKDKGNLPFDDGVTLYVQPSVSRYVHLIALNIMIYDNRNHPLDTRVEKHKAHAQVPESYISVDQLTLGPDDTFDRLKRDIRAYCIRCLNAKDLELYKSTEDRCAGRQADAWSTLREAGISDTGKVYLW